ncbi:class I SAM-dependent methyltransferase [Alteromonas ponticola]|uniref:Class I SAM-dependent methyltransferase n=1 Tax=Alteromonas aquimaris TaxID=2998417 RepID=A0ABT3P4A9_9ALTE|nr:class I SAM-dependent methyltransferase [Alteromonas aquimaris]MCW8107615.1 class I SAM-dependent methyltransferase [Alteromonas aquimaris]
MEKTIEQIMASYPYEKGGITVEEATALSKYAANITLGVIVEIGSFKGKSALALSHGVRSTQSESLTPIFCIDPHQAFTGELGGKFGPNDRKDFFQLMLDSGAYQEVSLINLESTIPAKGWDKPIGMLFIDGDHRYGAVKEDYQNWYPHVIDGGVIAFDDSRFLSGQTLGSAQFVDELIKAGAQPIETVGKITFFRKPCAKPVLRTTTSVRTLLVYAEQNIVCGGLIRFERLGHKLRRRGVEVSFCFENYNGTWQPTGFELLTPEEASNRNWGATLIPGAGFSDNFIESLSTITSKQFGIRIQAVLNDRSRRERFIAVNRAFKPDSVFFNNSDWEEGSYTDFLARKFTVIEGAVDCSHFYPAVSSKSKTKFVIGISTKSLERMMPVMQQLKGDEVLHVMGYIPEAVKQSEIFQKLHQRNAIVEEGILSEHELPAFYHKCHCIVHVEDHAGWANTAAEALACGVPLICTSAGTKAFATHKKTALILEKYSTEACVDAINEVINNPDEAILRASAGRTAIQRHDWDTFCDEFILLLNDDGREHYLRLPDLNMFGKWPVHTRTEVLPILKDLVEGASIFDAGCAEGYIGYLLLQAGCKRLDGVELDGGRILTARALSADDARANFIHASLSPWSDFIEKYNNKLLKKYDLVLYLAVHQHIPESERIATLTGLLARASKWFVMRIPASYYQDTQLNRMLSQSGFTLHSEHLSDNPGGAGPIRLYRRDN